MESTKILRKLNDGGMSKTALLRLSGLKPLQLRQYLYSLGTPSADLPQVNKDRLVNCDEFLTLLEYITGNNHKAYFYEEHQIVFQKDGEKYVAHLYELIESGIMDVATAADYVSNKNQVNDFPQIQRAFPYEYGFETVTMKDGHSSIAVKSIPLLTGEKLAFSYPLSTILF